MKTSDPVSNFAPVPTLFQIAAFFEDFFPHGRTRRCAPEARQLPFARLMINPKKLMKILNSGAAAVQAAPTTEDTRSSAKRAPRTGSSKKTTKQNTDTEKGGNQPENKQKLIEFTLKSAVASSVKLAGDFTDWEKCPVELEHSVDGLWSKVVPLEPGVYSYRFIVDGQWCDDPGCDVNVPNPFGTQNSVVHVA